MKLFECSTDLFGGTKVFFVMATCKNDALSKVLFYEREMITMLDRDTYGDIDMTIKIRELEDGIGEAHFDRYWVEQVDTKCPI